MSTTSAAIAAPPTGTAKTPVTSAEGQTEEKKADTEYLAGMSLVYRDRRLETAAEHLRVAVRLAPKKVDYQLALGCALVRRAHVLRDALDSPARYEKLKASYAERYNTWEPAQADKNSPLYGAKAPSPPVPPTTRDDDKAFTLAPEQTKEQINTLCRKAVAEWDTAFANAATDAERANVHYVRGWGMIVIKRISSQFVQNPAGSPTFGQNVPFLDEKWIPTQTQIAEEFQSAIDLAPNNALYWQSLGDAYVPDNDPKAWDREKAVTAYKKALTLDRRSPTLWYHLYRVQERNDLTSATDSIRTAANLDSGNAFYHYLLSDLLLKRVTEGNKTATTKLASNEQADASSSVSLDFRSPDLAAGLASLEKGNAGTLRPVTYTYAIPKILAPLNPFANPSGESDALGGDYIMALPQNIAKITKAYLAKEDPASTVAAISAAQSAVRFSEKILTLTDTQTNPGSEWMAWTFGGIAVGSSYNTLAETLELSGNASAAAEARINMQEKVKLTRMRAQRANEETKSFQR